jgi:hypothetical protein
MINDNVGPSFQNSDVPCHSFPSVSQSDAKPKELSPLPGRLRNQGPELKKFESLISPVFRSAPSVPTASIISLPLHQLGLEKYRSNCEMVQTSTIVATTVGTLATGFVGMESSCNS